MRLANQEAHRLNHQYIAAEHILLGLLKEGSGVTPSMLNKIQRDFRKVRSKLMERMDSPTSVITTAKLPYTAESKAVMEHAFEEAQNSGSRLVEPAHVLLGLVRESETIAGAVLLDFGINADEIRKDIANNDGV